MARLLGADIESVLRFRGGTKIALPGIHHDDHVRFVASLQDMRPDLDLL